MNETAPVNAGQKQYTRTAVSGRSTCETQLRVEDPPPLCAVTGFPGSRETPVGRSGRVGLGSLQEQTHTGGMCGKTRLSLVSSGSRTAV